MRINSDTAPTLPSPSSAPLARDADGHPIQLPDGATAWRIRRHTGGRPRHHLDAHKQPMLFPLHYSIADAEEILTPGTYRLDLVDAKGELLEVTVPITIGALRNANEASRPEPDDEHATEAVSTRLPASSSEVRLVLEANIRATQLAFQHNERTLTASLRMADTLREGVHVLAESQADWIKAVASSRGFLRNAAPPAQVLPPAPIESHTDDEEENDAGHEPPKEERLIEFGMAAMTLVNNLIETFRGGSKAAGSTDKQTASTGFDLRSLLDWRRAAPQTKSTQRESIPEAASTSPAALMRLVASLPPELVSKLQAVRDHLTADEQARLVPLLMAIGPDELPAVAAELMPTSIDEIAATFRAELAKRAAE